MRLIAAALLLTGACAHTTFNGQYLGRITAGAAIVAIGTALILKHEDDGGSDKHSRCRTCPPPEIVEPL